MIKYVDLNSDIGESFGAYTLGVDEQVMEHVSSVNIACGYHAGDPLIMDRTVQIAKKLGVAIGSHPGYPDLMGFGRRPMNISPVEARAYMLYQTGALFAFAKAHKIGLQHIKLHGAFYNTACIDKKLATAIVDAALSYDENIILMVLSQSLIVDIAKEKGARVAQEVFADRGYNDDGTLVKRGEAGAFITDEHEAIERIKKMVLSGKVTSASGKEIDIVADSICVHGDNEKAVLFVKTLKEGLASAGICVAPLNQWLK